MAYYYAPTQLGDFMRQPIAVFDFDGTLSDGVCGLRFFRYLLGDIGYCQFIFRNAFWSLLFLSRLSDEYALNKMVSSVFKGRKLEELTQIADEFSKEIMPHHLYDKIVQRLVWHKEQGHRNIIITRSLDLYMKPWGKQIEIHDMIATKLEVTDEGLLTGNIANHSFVGEKKLLALKELLRNQEHGTLYAYGDSTSDRYILAAADYAYWIRNPEDHVDLSLVDPLTHAQWKKNYKL